jgi:hypothetical protein
MRDLAISEEERNLRQQQAELVSNEHLECPQAFSY